LKVSQNAGALKLQFADAVNVDDVSAASAAGEASIKGESTTIEASALMNRALVP
jgi:hypothetical protein